MQSILGISSRSTLDIDLKSVKNKLSDQEILSIFNKICNLNFNDDIKYKVLSISQIAQEKRYGGKSVKIESKFYNIKKTFNVDIAMGDIVTP